MKKQIEFADFEKIEIVTGTILNAEIFKEARNPSYKLQIDFGSYGVKKSSAQITHLYTTNELIGKQIIAIINFKPKQIANFISECLVLGVYTPEKAVVLLTTEQKVKNGLSIF